MIAIEQFGMDPEQNGMMLSYIGVISLFMQGIGISTLTKRAEDKVLMAVSTVTLTVAYFVMVSHSFGLTAAVYNYNRRSAVGFKVRLLCSAVNFHYFHQVDSCVRIKI